MSINQFNSLSGQPNDTPNDTPDWDILTETTETPRILTPSEQTVERTRADFDNIIARNTQLVDRTKTRIQNLEQRRAAETDEWRIERFDQMITDANRALRNQESLIEFARIPTAEDLDYRLEVKRHFPNLIREAVPDDLPLVFHGSSNIGTIRDIIRTNGLLTPEQRGESMTSFATQIDVTAKTNINTSCDFADPSFPYMPYGAIFAFMPRPEEVDLVNRTGDSSEVFGGVAGVNFKTEPERLYGIITTPENIDRIQTWCRESGLDDSKVFTHADFLASMHNLPESHLESQPHPQP